MLSQHAKCSQAIQACSQPEAREVRHTIPTCINKDKLSQSAFAKSEARKARHTMPAYTAQTHYPGKQCEI